MIGKPRKKTSGNFETNVEQKQFFFRNKNFFIRNNNLTHWLGFDLFWARGNKHIFYFGPVWELNVIFNKNMWNSSKVMFLYIICFSFKSCSPWLLFILLCYVTNSIWLWWNNWFAKTKLLLKQMKKLTLKAL